MDTENTEKGLGFFRALSRNFTQVVDSAWSETEVSASYEPAGGGKTLCVNLFFSNKDGIRLRKYEPCFASNPIPNNTTTRLPVGVQFEV